MQLMEDLIATPHLLPDIITYNAVTLLCKSNMFFLDGAGGDSGVRRTRENPGRTLQTDCQQQAIVPRQAD